jgi:hypothetical protein
METMKITGIASSNPWSKKRRGHFVTLTTQKSGVRSITPQVMI